MFDGMYEFCQLSAGGSIGKAFVVLVNYRQCTALVRWRAMSPRYRITKLHVILSIVCHTLRTVRTCMCMKVIGLA